MRIINKTEWHTGDLRNLIERGVKDRLIVYGKRADLWRLLEVSVKYKRRGSGCLGNATVTRPLVIYYRISMSLFVSRYPGQIDPVQLAQTISHECDHVRGLHHRDMVLHQDPRFFQWAAGRRVRWCGAVPQRLAAQQEVPDGQA